MSTYGVYNEFIVNPIERICIATNEAAKTNANERKFFFDEASGMRIIGDNLSEFLVRNVKKKNYLWKR
jgi:hypothetical protein